MTSKNRLYILALCLSTIVQIGYAQQPFSNPVNNGTTVADGEWPSYNRTLTSERYSPLKQINTQNVASLKQVCIVDLKEAGNYPLTGPGSDTWPPSTPSPTPMLAGVTTTAGGLVITGDLNGDLLAFNATDGKQLWKQNTGAPIGGGVITYLVRGKQYVAVAIGLTSESWQTGGSNAKVAIYALP